MCERSRAHLILPEDGESWVCSLSEKIGDVERFDQTALKRIEKIADAGRYAHR